MKRDVQDGGRGERRLVENMNRKKEIIQTIDRIAGNIRLMKFSLIGSSAVL